MHNHFSQEDLSAVSMLVAYSSLLHAQLKVMRAHIPSLPDGVDRTKVAEALNCVEGCYSNAQQAALSAMAACSDGNYNEFHTAMEQFVFHFEPAKGIFNAVLKEIADAEIQQVEQALVYTQEGSQKAGAQTIKLESTNLENDPLASLESHLVPARQALERMRLSHPRGHKPDPILFSVAKVQALDHIKAGQTNLERLINTPSN